MACPELDFHPAAIDEARAARIWYENIDVALARQFMQELEAALNQVQEHPER